MTHCLNCDQHLSAPYCAHCGQKASTHRYSVKHFIEHDLVHGILHIDKGILFTVKGLFTRPGHSIREFIQGKRVGYFNFVTLILITLGVAHFLGSFSTITLADLSPKSGRAAMAVVEGFASKYPKLLLLVMVPITSLASFLWFRKARMNGTEHIVMNAYKTAAELILGMVFGIIAIFYQDLTVLPVIYAILSWLLIPAYNIWFYYQFFSTTGYSKPVLLLRSVMVLLTAGMFSAAIGYAVAWAMLHFK